jgi:hypothetical protein
VKIRVAAGSMRSCTGVFALDLGGSYPGAD